MGKLIFNYTDSVDNREASNIELTVPDDVNIKEFKILCIRLAHTMGFSEKTINKEFGNLIFGNENSHDIKALIHEITNPKNIKRS